MTLKQLRTELKAQGFKLQIRTLSWGRHATIIHIATKEAKPMIFRSSLELGIWEPVLNLLCLDSVADLAKEEKIYGLALSKAGKDS